MSKSNNMTVPRSKELCSGGGGSLGAYEAGVLKVLCKKLAEEDKEVSKKNGENRLLFDIIAGTSIGAMNGAILVSQFLQTGNWEKAAESLNSFWIDKKNGQALLHHKERSRKFQDGLSGKRHQIRILEVLLQKRLPEETIQQNTFLSMDYQTCIFLPMSNGFISSSLMMMIRLLNGLFIAPSRYKIV